MNELDLDVIASRLEGLEETIVSKLIDRAQFSRNKLAYEPGKSGFEGGGPESLFVLRLRYQEEVDAVFGRFTVPEERPFCRDLPAPRRTVTHPDSRLRIDDYDRVNLTQAVTREYRRLLDWLCPPGDDGQYGSSVEHDVFAVQAISRRVHFGAFFVGESKYRAAPNRFEALKADGDPAALEAALTRPEVEARILERVREKVHHLQAHVNTKVRTVIDAERVVDLYRSVIIPMTKRGEVLYLMARGE